jgi:hypothetical protein
LVVLLLAGRAWADQVAHVTINEKPHDLTIPDGWSAVPQEGGVVLTPPPGRAPSVIIMLSGVARAKDFHDPNLIVDKFVTDEMSKHPGSAREANFERTFVGMRGSTGAMTFDDDNKKRNVIAYVAALTEETAYVMRISGIVDETSQPQVTKEINAIVDGVAVSKAKPAGAGSGNAAPAQSWLADKAMPKPATGEPLVVDDQLGVNVGPAPGWGVMDTTNAYLLERRFGDTHRVVVSVYTSDVSFQGNGDEYLDAVARKAKLAYRWDRFARKQTLVVKKPPSLDGAGDTLEYHVMRAGRPLIFQFRLDGGRWGDAATRDAEAARSELETFIKVEEQPELGKSIPIANGVVTVTPPAGWTSRQYGPGPMLLVEGPNELEAVVAVTMSPFSLTCLDNTPAKTQSSSVLRSAAKEYRCPPAGGGVLLMYEMPHGAQTVYVGFGYSSGNKGRKLDEAVVAAFVRGLKAR